MLDSKINDEMNKRADQDRAFAALMAAVVNMLEVQGIPHHTIGSWLLGAAMGFGQSSQGRALWLAVLKEAVRRLEREEAISRMGDPGNDR